MIITRNRIQVQTENGETEVLVLMAIAHAAFALAPKGLDQDDEYDPDQDLDVEEAAEHIELTIRGYELIMMTELHGRDLRVHVAPTLGIKGHLDVNRDVYEGDVAELLAKANEIIDGFITMNRRSSSPELH